MAFLKKINTKAKTASNTGFGDNASSYGGRFLNKSGQANIRKTGIGFFEKYSWFHSMLALSWFRFFLVVLIFYILVNLLFAVVYYLLGVQHLAGMSTNTELEKFGEAFFFSAQTFTTVGYGRISPTGFATSAIAAIQALVGLLSFAVATGLMYGRFSKPTAYLKFSHNAIIAPYRGITALMVRVAPFKNTTLTEAEARLTLGMMIEDNGRQVNRFFPLEMELEKVNALTLSWTLVHPITENSPIYGYSKADYQHTSGEVIVFIKAFDDMFSNTVVVRSSYTFNEIVYGAVFNPMYYRDENNSSTVLNLDKLNDYREVSL
ncbi:MAG: ion channel [Ferruginibacter sp.]